MDDEARAGHDDDEAWQRFMGRSRDSRRRRRRRDLGFAWALLLGMLAVGVLVGLLVGRISGNQEEAASTRPPTTVTVEKTVPVETTVEKTVPAATTATPTATATATARSTTATPTATAAPTTTTATPTTTPAAIQYQYGRTGLPPGTIDGGASSPIGEARR